MKDEVIIYDAPGYEEEATIYGAYDYITHAAMFEENLPSDEFLFELIYFSKLMEFYLRNDEDGEFNSNTKEKDPEILKFCAMLIDKHMGGVELKGWPTHETEYWPQDFGHHQYSDHLSQLVIPPSFDEEKFIRNKERLVMADIVATANKYFFPPIQDYAEYTNEKFLKGKTPPPDYKFLKGLKHLFEKGKYSENYISNQMELLFGEVLDGRKWFQDVAKPMLRDIERDLNKSFVECLKDWKIKYPDHLEHLPLIPLANNEAKLHRETKKLADDLFLTKKNEWQELLSRIENHSHLIKKAILEGESHFYKNGHYSQQIWTKCLLGREIEELKIYNNPSQVLKTAERMAEAQFLEYLIDHQQQGSLALESSLDNAQFSVLAKFLSEIGLFQQSAEVQGKSISKARRFLAKHFLSLDKRNDSHTPMSEKSIQPKAKHNEIAKKLVEVFKKLP